MQNIFSHAATASLLAILVAGAVAPEVSAQTTNEPCDVHMDISLVIDRSGSMSGTRLTTAKAGVSHLLNSLGTGDRSGLVSYASTHILDLSVANANHQATDAAVQALAAGGGTNAEPGIRESRIDLINNGRNGASQIMIHLTDGHSGGNPAAEAALAKAAGIQVYVIGIGSNVNTADLQSQASTPLSKYYHNPQNSTQLIAVFEQITDSIMGGNAYAESYAEWNRIESTTGAIVANGNRVNHETYPPGGSEVIFRETVAGHGVEVFVDAIDNSAGGDIQVAQTESFARSVITGLDVRVNGVSYVKADVLVAEAWAMARMGWSGYDDGESGVTNLWVLGSPTLSWQPNMEIPLGPVGHLILNEQIIDQTNGTASIEVNAIHLHVDVAEAGTETADVIISHALASAYCGTDEPIPPCDPDTDPTCAPPCDNPEIIHTGLMDPCCTPEPSAEVDVKGRRVDVDTGDPCTPCADVQAAVTDCIPCDNSPIAPILDVDPCKVCLEAKSCIPCVRLTDCAPCESLPKTELVDPCNPCTTDCDPCALIPVVFDCNVECRLPRVPDLSADPKVAVQQIMRELAELECNVLNGRG